jgi:hypothetical protein
MNIRGVGQSGSALIITILLVTVLVGIAFGTSRLTISEIVQSSRLEDSELAFQAAEGCIETGLLFYRYNRNAEAPQGVDGGMSQSVDEFMYIDISSGEILGNISNSDFESIRKSHPDRSYCALRMWHRHDEGEPEEVLTSQCSQDQYQARLCVEVPDNKIANLCDGANTCYEDDGRYYIMPALAQDDVVEYAIEYDVTGLESINIDWDYLEERLDFGPFCNKYPDECDPENWDNYRNSFQLLYLPIDEEGEVMLEMGYKQLLDYDRRQDNEKLNLQGVSKIRIKPFRGSLESYTITTNEPTAKLDTRYTMIESTGYYGSAKRKLKNILDRKTKSLLSPYDFLLYSSEEK